MGEPAKDPQGRAAEVLLEYAAMIEDSEIHHSGPNKGKCDAEPQAEIDEYRALAAALEARQWIPIEKRLPDDDLTVMVAIKEGDEPVWLGYHDADGWTSATDGAPITQIVSHWKHLPAGPA